MSAENVVCQNEACFVQLAFTPKKASDRSPNTETGQIGTVSLKSSEIYGWESEK